MNIHINEERFLNTLKLSSSVGKNSKGGLSRLALSKTDKQIRDIFVDWLEKEQLEVRIDDFGNIYGRREGENKNAPVVAMGSHLDTQPTGGRFDGVLGVLAALEVIRTLNDHQIETNHPIEIINFTNEEGARFIPPMLGSGGITGVFTKDYVYRRSDEDRVSFETALQKINYQGRKENRIKNIKNFIELHIEQGPILDMENKDIGIVTGIQGMSWLSVEISGMENHAGPTPMEYRKDSLVIAAEMIRAINQIPREIKGLLTTVGKISNYPNVVNVIPGKTEFKIDVRHPDDKKREQALRIIEENLNEIADDFAVSVAIYSEWDSPATEFSEEVIQAITHSCKTAGYSTRKLFSGPGHDAKYMSRIANTGMIFVKSVDGISHNEAEFTSNRDLIRGANTLLFTILQLVNN